MSAEFWPWWWGGLAVGAVATLYPLASGRLLGVSSLYASLVEKKPAAAPLSELEAALLAETEAEFGASSAVTPPSRARLARWRVESERFRPLFLLGMVIGPLAFVFLEGKLTLSLSLGQSFDARYGGFGVAPMLVLLASGVLIGFGTRWAGGCTSGHGISGFARGERGSLLSTAAFWSTALAVTWLFTLFGRR